MQYDKDIPDYELIECQKCKQNNMVKKYPNHLRPICGKCRYPLINNDDDEILEAVYEVNSKSDDNSWDNKTEMKKCPFCSKLIHEHAAKCICCGEWLNRKTVNNMASKNYNTYGSRSGNSSSSWVEFRENVFQKYGRHCDRCGSKSNLHIHHKIPLSMGGSNEIGNLVVLCESCHEGTHGREFYYNDDFRDYESEDSSNVKETKLKKINDSITYWNSITIRYKKIDGTISIRKIQPTEIHQWNGRIYVKAFCYLRNAKRTFRISRIKQIT